ncbi:MAG: flavodoxin domain-containing protein [Pseudomonadota bacterium]
MASVSIIVGTVYGTAKALAEDIKSELENANHSVSIIENAKAGDIPTEDGAILLVCTSTTGAGELPGNLEPLYDELKANPQSLGHLRYAVVNLGDSSFGDTYCGAGKLMDELLSEQGASALSPPLEIDACETMMPEDEAVPWAADVFASA